MTKEEKLYEITISEGYNLYNDGKTMWIYGIKRLEDNVEFEIGDLILEQGEVSKILSFREIGNYMRIRIHHTVTKGFSTLTIGTSKFEKVQPNTINNIEVANFN